METTLRLDYDQGIRMLQEAGVHVDPMGDLNTEAEKKLGVLVRDKGASLEPCQRFSVACLIWDSG